MALETAVLLSFGKWDQFIAILEELRNANIILPAKGVRFLTLSGTGIQPTDRSRACLDAMVAAGVLTYEHIQSTFQAPSFRENTEYTTPQDEQGGDDDGRVECVTVTITVNYLAINQIDMDKFAHNARAYIASLQNAGPSISQQPTQRFIQ